MRRAAQRGVITADGFEQLAGPSISKGARLWLAFWARADEVGKYGRKDKHYLWRGPFERRSPVFQPPKGPALPAREVAWAWVFSKSPKRPGALRPACGEPRCIRPEHQEVVSSRAS